MMKRAPLIALVGALALTPDLAWSGQKNTTNVIVRIEVEARNAWGALGGARNSPDTQQYIGCSLWSSSGTAAPWGMCRAQTEAGVNATCLFNNKPAFEKIVGFMSSDSWVYFHWDANGWCTNIQVENWSTYEPKQ